MNRLLLSFAAVLLALLPGPAAWASPSSGTVAESAGELVVFTSADGVELRGQLFRSESAVQQSRGGILFVHEPNRSRRDWAYMAQKMSRHGFTTLTFDLRGHGESLRKGEEELDREIFMDEDYAAMSQDVDAAVDFLRSQPDVAELGLQMAGADLGGSLSLLHAVENPQVHSVALLSPGLGYDRVNIIGSGLKLGARNLIMVFSIEDSYSKKSTEVLAKERGDRPTHIEILYGVGHGTKMLSRDPELEVLLMRWFMGRIFAQDGRVAGDVHKPDVVDKAAPSYDVDAEKERREAASSEAKKSSIKAVDEGAEDSQRKSWEEEE